MKKLERKICLITGGAHGIGARTAKLFEENGAVVIVVDKDVERGQKIASESKGNIVFKYCDLTSVSEIEQLTSWIDSRFPRIDALINNASRGERYSLLDISEDNWNATLALNLTAPFLLSRYVAQKMIGTGTKGKIINISAVQAKSPLDSSFAYATTKGALISMTKSLAVDLGRYGILVNAVLPGPIYTMEDTEEPPSSLDSNAATLLGRMGRTTEIAFLLLFLVSEENSFMTGNEIVFDGGRLISRKPDPEEIQKEGKRSQ
jgi:glucose 1-dehydrogenase